MAKEKKRHASVVAKLVDRVTGEHVGFLYEWNTGERQNAWFDEPHVDVVIRELIDEVVPEDEIE